MNHSTTREDRLPQLVSPIRRRKRAGRRSAKILVLFVIILPALLAVLGVVVDSGLLSAHQRQLQNIADAAATTAAMDVFRGVSVRQAEFTVQEYVQRHNALADARVRLNHPPLQGRYASNPRYVELEVARDVRTYLVHVLGGPSTHTVSALAVAGFEPSTANAAITILSATPNQQNAGLDLVGRSTVTIAGAVLVNNESGALDEDGLPAGRRAGPPFGIRSSGEILVATELRVAGGVDDPRYYQRTNLSANQLPVEDPLGQLRPPATPRTNHGRSSQNEFGGVEIPSGWGKSRGRSQQQTLDPGLYDWIQVNSGSVVFRPGIYIIQSVHPRTGIALNLQGGDVTANGVLFYIDTASRLTGPRYPYESDDDRDAYGGDFFYSGRAAVSFWSTGSTRSVIINVGSQSQFSPLRDGASPYDGLLLFQNQNDRRTIEINQTSNSSSQLSGIVYAKSGHVSMTARGTSRAAFVVGTMRINAATGCRIEPLRLLPPAEDVYLVE